MNSTVDETATVVDTLRGALAAATSAREQAEVTSRAVWQQSADLRARHSQAENAASELKRVALESAGDEKKFSAAVKTASEAGILAEFLRLAVERCETKTARNARRRLLAAQLAECDAREQLQRALISAFEEKAKETLQRTAEVLGGFEVDGLGDYHESLLDELEEIQRAARNTKADLRALEQGERP